MERRLHFVVGKGGVGKSTVAAALAIAAARRGERVLAIELGEPAGLCRIFATIPASPGAIATADGVSIAFFDGASALAEYLALHAGRIARAIVEHPLYRAFVGAAPGVRELMAIGKIRDEFALQHRWDVVVVDAGASGHALEHLRMPAATSDAFASGRVHREAEANAALLRDRARCAIHVVAVPERMALREGVQTIGALRELDLATGAFVVNRCIPRAPEAANSAIAGLGEPALESWLRRELAHVVAQESGITAVERELFVDALRLPRLRAPDGIAQAGELAHFVGEIV